MSVPHVAEYIEEEMRKRGWTVEDVALRMENDLYRSEEEYEIDLLTVELTLAVRDLRCGIGQETARKLGVAFSVSPDLFLNLDKAWRESIGTEAGE